jgi:uncharacterized Ntn-hydrolase superfamily protein
MTYSLLSIDEKTGALVAAAATGSLCVGGWVIRGRLGAGLVASQGTAPSTLWRDAVLRRMEDGVPADRAVAEITGADPGRGYRQLAALDPQGGTAGFTGDASVAYAAHVAGDGMIVAGNMLSGPEVLDAMREGWTGSDARGTRLCARWRRSTPRNARAAMHAGSCRRRSWCCGRMRRRSICASTGATRPCATCATCSNAVRTPPYADWLDEVPTELAPTRAPGLPRAAE